MSEKINVVVSQFCSRWVPTRWEACFLLFGDWHKGMVIFPITISNHHGTICTVVLTVLVGWKSFQGDNGQNKGQTCLAQKCFLPVAFCVCVCADEVVARPQALWADSKQVDQFCSQRRKHIQFLKLSVEQKFAMNLHLFFSLMHVDIDVVVAQLCCSVSDAMHCF